jgi:uncharacterized protein
MDGAGGVMTLVSGGAAFLAVYLSVFAALALVQRSMLYRPQVGLVAPAQAGLADFETLRLRTEDGETLEAWHRPPKAERFPLILYFHGNGGALESRADRFRRLAGRGYGLIAVSYRGYGASTGTPTEEGLVRDAEAAYAEARRRGFAPERIVLMGESLGAGVATMIAARRDAAALVLDSPYSSVLELAASLFPIFPVSLVLADPFRADQAIPQVRAPVLMVVGGLDRVTPPDSARRLFDLANEPKLMIELPRAGHIAMASPGALERAMEWIDATVTRATPARDRAR